LNFSPNIIIMAISRRMRQTGHVASMEEKRIPFNISAGKLEGKIPLRRVRLRWASKRYGRWAWTRVFWLRTGTNGGFL
jgi:hypothetical protein